MYIAAKKHNSSSININITFALFKNYAKNQYFHPFSYAFRLFFASAKIG
jgi:hypothetical protein